MHSVILAYINIHIHTMLYAMGAQLNSITLVAECTERCLSPPTSTLVLFCRETKAQRERRDWPAPTGRSWVAEHRLKSHSERVKSQRRHQHPQSTIHFSTLYHHFKSTKVHCVCTTYTMYLQIQILLCLA